MAAHCPVCMRPCDAPALDLAAPAITSTGGFLETPVKVFVCGACGHARSTEMANLEQFYDTQYRISLSTDEHDQLYDATPLGPVYRTDKQADLVLKLCTPARGALVLDYGAGKAETLRKIVARRRDVTPHVFDVSQAYAEHWAAWLDQSRCSTYALPDAWRGRFDLVTAHFVLEHVSDPLKKLRAIRNVLKEGGTLFVSVPNAATNSGDLLVADHINHFSETSLRRAVEASGFTATALHKENFRGAYIIIAKADGQPTAASAAPSSDLDELTPLCAFWRDATTRLERAAPFYAKRKCAIYGAGFYGSYLLSRIQTDVKPLCFIDRNPHVQAAPHLGLPVYSPADLPEDIEVIFAGLNPANARAALTDVPEWKDRSIKIVFLD